MAWTWRGSRGTGSSLFAVALVVALALQLSSAGVPNLGLPGQAGSTIAGVLKGVTGPLKGVTGTLRHVRATLIHGPRTFYVSPDGRDSNRGTSPARPWRTVTRVNRAALEPGDRVLFEGGATFSDATLMPGYGMGASGTRGDPIVFGSYGRGKARLTRGIWLGTDAADPDGPSNLTFEHLSLGPVRGFQGTGDYIKLIGLTISGMSGPQSSQETGIESEGSHWVIADNKIFDTGDSGMLLGFSADAPGDPAGGMDYVITGNTVSHTGLDSGISWPKHAIYLKVANARISDNRLTYFDQDGISMRYRDSTVTDNYIAHGGIGLAWYQYDTLPGMTELIGNTIAYTSHAIFVCGVAESCSRPLESFVIERNRLRGTSGRPLNLQPTKGTYLVRANPGL